MDGDGIADGDDILSDGALAALQKRIGAVRESENARKHAAMVAAANNWRTGDCVQRTVVVLDDLLRRAKRVGERLACGTCAGAVLLLEVGTGEILQRWEDIDDGDEQAEITALDFDGEQLSSGDSSGAVVLRRVGDEAAVLRARHRGPVSGVHWQGSDRAYSCSVDGRFVCHDVTSAREHAHLNMRAPILAMCSNAKFTL